MFTPSAVPFLRILLMLGTIPALCFVSGCSPTVTVPDLVGTDRSAAAATLAEVELTLGTITSIYDETAPLGGILSQNPPSGDKVPRGTAVSLVVSRGRVILANVSTSAAASAQNGLTWDTAYDTLQEALDAAYFRSAEVWVARGSYAENRAAKNTEGALELREGIALYGGFSGVENFREERNWSSNVTVIDGSDALAGSPAYHVVVGAQDARLDGVTVRGGGTEDIAGGGMVNGNVSLTVANCTFADNVGIRGGAMDIWGADSSITVTGCTFTRNRAAYHGGGIIVDVGTLTVTDGIFDNNTADNDGAAICGAGADVTVLNTTFSRNSATAYGGAIYTFNGGTAVYTNCQFYGNDAQNGSAVAVAMALSSASLTNCTLQGNTAGPLGGGAVWAVHASLAASNSIFWGNTGGDEIVLGDAVSATIGHCCIEGGLAAGGTAILTEDPRFISAPGHDLRLQSNSPCLDTATWVDAPEEDIRGVARPQGTGIDMGAYEMTAADYE